VDRENFKIRSFIILALHYV